jgi:hypothetical protein
MNHATASSILSELGVPLVEKSNNTFRSAALDAFVLIPFNWFPPHHVRLDLMARKNDIRFLKSGATTLSGKFVPALTMGNERLQPITVILFPGGMFNKNRGGHQRLPSSLSHRPCWGGIW